MSISYVFTANRQTQITRGHLKTPVACFFRTKVLIHNACDRGIVMHGSANSFARVKALTALCQDSESLRKISGRKEPFKIRGDVFLEPPVIHGHTSSYIIIHLSESSKKKLGPNSTNGDR